MLTHHCVHGTVHTVNVASDFQIIHIITITVLKSQIEKVSVSFELWTASTNKCLSITWVELLISLENTLPSSVSSHYITQGSLAHVPHQWGKQAPTPAPVLFYTLLLSHTHTPPVMFTGLRKESINSDLVAVSCGRLCEVVTFSE